MTQPSTNSTEEREQLASELMRMHDSEWPPEAMADGFDKDTALAIADFIQAGYIPKQAVLDAIGEDIEYSAGYRGDSRELTEDMLNHYIKQIQFNYPDAAGYNRRGNQIRQSLNLHDNQERNEA